jgi:multicomponent Na+:H+ antiporter subunit G
VLGIMLLMLGVGLRLQSPAVIGVLVLIVMLQFVTAPVSAHLTVRSAYRNSVDEGTVDAVETLEDGAASVDGDRMPEKPNG